jgi:hypothetical protein
MHAVAIAMPVSVRLMRGFTAALAHLASPTEATTVRERGMAAHAPPSDPLPSASVSGGSNESRPVVIGRHRLRVSLVLSAT